MKNIAWNKGQRKYNNKCKNCLKKIDAHYNKKYCDNKCYFDSKQFKEHLIKNGKEHKGKKIKEYRISREYKYLFIPDHPDSNKQGYLAEHRYIAEKELGRKLESNEIVHHIDGDRGNNNWNNLIVLTKEKHNKLHSYMFFRK